MASTGNSKTSIMLWQVSRDLQVISACSNKPMRSSFSNRLHRLSHKYPKAVYRRLSSLYTRRLYNYTSPCNRRNLQHKVKA